MKYFELDKQETAITTDLERGAFRRVKSFAKDKIAYRGYAANDLKKTRSINIRISEHDLLKIKAKALKEGIPYQTYFTSVVHKSLSQ